MQDWIVAVGAKTADSVPGNPWKNGFIDLLNARLRGELLDGEIFYGLKEAKVVVEGWRRHYNTVSPHSSCGYKRPAREMFIPTFAARPASPNRAAWPAAFPLAPRPALH